MHLNLDPRAFLHPLWYYFWIAPHVLQALILYFMVRRKLHHQFPFFAVYIASEIVQFAVLYGLSHSRFHYGPVYLHSYVSFLGLSTAVRFAVIYEIVNHVLGRYPTVDEAGRHFFRFSTVLLLLLAVLLAVLMPRSQSEFILTATYSLDRAVSILQCGLLLSMFVFSRYFSLSWNSLDFGIAVGMGVFASVELATSAMWLHLGSFGNTAVNLLTMGTYHCCVLIWLFYVLKPEKVSAAVPKTLPDHDLEVWNQELQRMVRS